MLPTTSGMVCVSHVIVFRAPREASLGFALYFALDEWALGS